MEVCERLKNARESKGWSQAELASMLGMTQQAYHPYEHEREMKSDMIIKICAILECSPNWLLGVKDEGMTLAPDSALMKELRAAFDRLSEPGQREAVKRVQELTKLPEYVLEVKKTAETMPDNSDSISAIGA